MGTNLRLEDWAGREVHVLVDRPLGSTHPDGHALVYEVNYGFIPGTMAADGEPIDVYVLGAGVPLKSCTARVVAIIHRRDDLEDKIVVALSGQWDAAAIASATAFQERWFDSWVELA